MEPTRTRTLIACATAAAFLACKAAKRAEPDAAIATATPTPTATATVTPPRADKDIDLVKFTRSSVAVSSKVDNPKDYPEHLIDGKPETAWNGKTGDLVGGWIAFRVPAEVRVRRVRLTAGFDKGDLFEKNVRIAKLEITRDGKPVKAATLDTAKRELQTIELDEPGGDFRLKVIAVVPGTRADYKELCVSELQVLGDPRTARLPKPDLPTVYVGSLDGNVRPPAPKEPTFSPGPYATPEAFCAAQMRAWGPALKTAWGDGTRYPGTITPSCTIEDLGAKSALAPPFLEAKRFHANYTSEVKGGVLLKTTKGWYETWSLWASPHDDPGCLHAGGVRIEELASPDPTRPLAWLRVLDAESYWAQMVAGPDGQMTDQMESWASWTETLYVVRAAPDGTLTFEPAKTLGEARVDHASQDPLSEKPPWKKGRKAPSLGDAGSVELVDAR